MNSKKLIFCISTGRTGSKYFTKLFAASDKTSSFHEPKPTFNGEIMQNYLKGNTNPLSIRIDEKLECINQVCLNKDIYVETNHCFIKGFGWELLKSLQEEKVCVLIIKRDHSSVAKSYQKLGCSQFTYKSKLWLVDPDIYYKELNSLFENVKFTCSNFIYIGLRLLRKIKIIKNERHFLPNFILKQEVDYLEWYCRKIEALTVKFKLEFPHVKYFDLNFEDINNKEVILNMLEKFEVTEISEDITNSNVFGNRVNTRLVND